MHTPARAKPGLVHLVLIGALLLVIAFAPSVVASSVTAQNTPVRFMSQPWNGWSFAGKVLTSSMTAHAASPGAALRIAHETWREQLDISAATKGAAASDAAAAEEEAPVTDEPAPTKVQLLYLPGRAEVSFDALTTPDGIEQATFTSGHDLVWQVTGRYSERGAEGVIGLLDFRSGAVLWDVRTAGREAG